MAKIIGIDLGTTNSAAAVMSGGEPVVIEADEFRTGAVRRHLASSANPVTVASVFSSGRGDGHSNETLTTEVRLFSARQPEVRKLVCGFWGDPALERHLSIAQIRATLGSLASINLAP